MTANNGHDVNRLADLGPDLVQTSVWVAVDANGRLARAFDRDELAQAIEDEDLAAPVSVTEVELTIPLPCVSRVVAVLPAPRGDVTVKVA